MITRVFFIGSILTLFALAYMRFTWFVDLNASGRPLLVRIHQMGKAQEHSAYFLQNNRPVVNDNLRIRSVWAYWILFGLINMALLGSYFKNKFAVIAHIVLYLALSLLSLALFAFWKYFIPEDFLFQMASKVKNFLLTPLYSGLVFIFVKYFDSFVKNRER